MSAKRNTLKWCLLLSLFGQFALIGASKTLKVAVLQPITTGNLDSSDCVSQYINGQCYYGDNFRAMSACGILAAKHFNERHALYVPEFSNLCDLQIDLRVFDAPPNSPKLAVTSLLQLIADFDPHVVVGASSSANSKPTSILTGVFDIPQISYWATSNQLDNVEDYPRFLRTIPTDDAVSFATCRFWKLLNYRYAGIFYVNDAYGEAFKESIVRHCTEMGFQRIISSAFDPSASDEVIKEQVKTLANSGVKVFLYVDYTDKTRIILSAAYEYGILGKGYLWVFGESVYTDDISSLHPEVLEAVNGSIRIYSPGGVQTNERWKAFTKNWRGNNVSYLNSFLPENFQASFTFFNDSDPFVTEVKVPGVYQYDAVAAVGLIACRMAPEEINSSNFGTMFWNKKEEVGFEGLSGTVKFNSIGNRDEQTANYEMSNIRMVKGEGNMVLLPVATFNETSSTWLFLDNLVFNGGSQEVPNDVIVPEEDMKWDGGIRKMCLFLCLFNIFLALSFILWTVIHRKHAIVRASQIHFLLLISIGAIVSSLAIYPVTIDDQFGQRATENGGNAKANRACNAQIWLYCIGFILTFVPLFARIWRVKKVFNIGQRNKLQKHSIQNTTLISIIIGLLVLEVTILLIWTCVDPLVYTRRVILSDEFDNPLESTGGCESNNSTVFIFLLVLLHLSVLTYGNYLCYQCRGINSAFAESKYVSIAMFSNLQVLALGIPVLIIVADDPQPNKFIRAGIIFLNDFTVQVLIYVPKILHVNFGVYLTGGQGSDFVTPSIPQNKLDRSNGPNPSQIYSPQSGGSTNQVVPNSTIDLSSHVSSHLTLQLH